MLTVEHVIYGAGDGFVVVYVGSGIKSIRITYMSAGALVRLDSLNKSQIVYGEFLNFCACVVRTILFKI